MKRAILFFFFILIVVDSFAQSRDTTVIIGGELNEAIISSSIIHQTTSPVQISSLKVFSAPALFGETDPLKVVMLIPGIQNNNEGDVGIIIRGGNFDQSQISINNVPIYNPSHLKGFVSAFNSDIISGIDIYKGAFPSKYGGRLSGVVNVITKEGNDSSFHAGLTIGVLSAKAFVEGPIFKGKTSFIASARKSYFNLILGPIFNKITGNSSGLIDQFSRTNYWDANAVITHKYGNKDKFSLSFYMGEDRMFLSGSSDESEQIDNSSRLVKQYYNDAQTYENWGNIASSIAWNRLIKDKIDINTYLYYAQYKQSYNQNSYNQYSETPIDSTIMTHKENITNDLTINSGIYNLSLGTDFRHAAFKGHLITAGTKYDIQYFTPYTDVKRTIETLDTIISSNNIMGENLYLNSLSVYVEDEIQVIKWLKASLGLRMSFYLAGGKLYSVPEPRARLLFKLSDDISLKASYSRMSQGIHLLSSTNVVSPSDIWVPVTKNMAPMTSNNVTLGVFYSPKIGENEIVFSIEGYYKTMNNLLEYLDGASFILGKNWEDKVDVGKGLSYGAEFFAQKEFGKTTGSLSYTWSKSLRKFDNINGGKEFFASNDCRNNVSVTVCHKFGNHFDLSATFVYMTGKRITIPNVLIDGYYNLTLPLYLRNKDISQVFDNTTLLSSEEKYYLLSRSFITYRERNSYKMEDYHRLDISFNWYIFHKFGKSTINVSVYNVYNHQNPYKLYVSQINNKYSLKQLCILPIMPSISYTFSF